MRNGKSAERANAGDVGDGVGGGCEYGGHGYQLLVGGWGYC